MTDKLFELYKEIVIPEKIWFWEGQEENYGGITKNKTIWINISYSDTQQLLTLAHEPLHFYERFEEYSERVLNLGFSSPEIENNITNFGRCILDVRPDIKDFLQVKLNEAKKLAEERSF